MLRSRLTTCLGDQNESSMVTCVNRSGTYWRRTALSAVSGVGVSVAVLKICFLFSVLDKVSAMPCTALRCFHRTGTIYRARTMKTVIFNVNTVKMKSTVINQQTEQESRPCTAGRAPGRAVGTGCCGV